MKRVLKFFFRLLPAGARPRVARVWHAAVDPPPPKTFVDNGLPRDIDVMLDRMLHEMTQVQLQLQALTDTVRRLEQGRAAAANGDGPGGRA